MKTEEITFRNTFRYWKVKCERLGTKFLSFGTLPRKPYLLTLRTIWDQYILKKWIALKVRSDWLVKHRISFVIIQQIVTLSKYGHDALDICHP